jgi:hypothetical protein
VESLDGRRAEAEGIVGTEILIEGIADNSGGEGIDHAKTLQATFGSTPGMRRSAIQLGNLAEGSYPFELLVSPDEKLPEAGARGGARPRAGRGPR